MFHVTGVYRVQLLRISKGSNHLDHRCPFESLVRLELSSERFDGIENYLGYNMVFFACRVGFLARRLRLATRTKTTRTRVTNSLEVIYKVKRYD